tara:strand:+ start:6956 stop:7591 length:636 start_codon:yes stop_codon:yes gene_type:complete
MKSINNFLLFLIATSSFLIFSLIQKKELKDLEKKNIIISRSYYPIKGLHYQRIIQEVKEKNLKSYQKNLVSGGGVKAIFHLLPLNIPQPKNNICQLSKKDFFWKIKINYTLPQWKSRHIADQKFKDRWDKYLKRLISHEDRHRDIFLKGATAIRSYINHIPPYQLRNKSDNCLNYVGQVKQRLLLIFKKYEVKNLFFDLNSNFGIKNGVLL